MYHIIELQDSNQSGIITKSVLLIPHDMDANFIPGLCIITFLSPLITVKLIQMSAWEEIAWEDLLVSQWIAQLFYHQESGVDS